MTQDAWPDAENKLPQEADTQIRLLAEASKALFAMVQPEELYHRGLQELIKVLHADEGSLMLLNSENSLQVAACVGLPEDVARGVHLKLGARVAGKAAAENRSWLLNGSLENYPEFSGIDANRRIHSSIVLPLFAQDELLGVLSLNRTKSQEKFTDSDLQSAEILSTLLGLALRNAHSYARMERKINDLKKAYSMLEETQIRLVESQKLASIGQLVAGVSHELNNPLTNMLCYTELALEKVSDPDIQRKLSLVLKEARRSARIVQDLLAFARKSKPHLEATDICKVLDESVELVHDLLQKTSVVIIREYPAHHPVLRADEHQLRQVFLNLLTNACHALEQMPHDRRINIAVRVLDGRAEIVVSDNGPGIAGEHLGKIFDPFFTTKKNGKGTGLGLSLCYGIVKEHGGDISVKSSSGCGASFSIKLPADPADQAESVKEIPKIVSKTVLVVDDEEMLRDLVCDTLQENGYQTDSAADGEEALKKALEKTYDLILCDYVMPRMNGKIFFEELRRVKPDQAAKVMFVTGSITGEDLTSYFKKNSVPYLIKPFTEDTLLKSVKLSLESQGPEGLANPAAA